MTQRLIIDTETTGLDFRRGAYVFSISESDITEPEKVRIIRLEYPHERSTGINQGIVQKYWDHLNHLFFFRWSGAPTLTFHNAKFDLRALDALGRELGMWTSKRGLWWAVDFDCTYVLSKLLRNDHYSHSLDDLCFDLCKYDRIDADVHAKAREYGGMQYVDVLEMDEYQRHDNKRTAILWNLFQYVLGQEDPESREKLLALYELEKFMICLCLDMEDRGMTIDPDGCAQLIQKLELAVDLDKKHLAETLGEDFNHASPLQKRALIYDTWGYAIQKKTKTGEPSADKHVLMKIIQEPDEPEHVKICDLLLRIDSYTRGAAQVRDYHAHAIDGVIHPQIHPMGASTGRQSSSKPNLQNVQKDGALLNLHPIPARTCFKNRDGYINLYIDYSGIELRLLLLYADEPELISAVRNGADVHHLAAETFYRGTDLEEYLDVECERYSELRAAGKNANFACPYGAGPAKIVQTLGLSEKQGYAAYGRYRQRFPKLVALSKKISKHVYKDGYVETKFGRRIHVPRYEAYKGTNYLIQGTAADVLKYAEREIEWVDRGFDDRIGLIMSIHDEVVIEYPVAILQGLREYLSQIHRVMIQIPRITKHIPLEVEVSTSVGTWADKEPIEQVFPGVTSWS